MGNRQKNASSRIATPVFVSAYVHTMFFASFPSWTSWVRIPSPALDRKCLKRTGLRTRAFLMREGQCPMKTPFAEELVQSWSLGVILELLDPPPPRRVRRR
jgi:hypothetical protein